jgi:beta-phosphoglucomutase
MLKAIIFDCDGVIADTEPLHLAAFQKVLAGEGIGLSTEEYYREYLALDDRGCFTKVFREHQKPLDDARLRLLIDRKAASIEPVMRERLRLFPGVAEFIRAAADKYPLAIASGALRREVELITGLGGLRDCFGVVVTAEDVERSKPHPDPFLKACSLINARGAAMVEARECLVVEDSIHGIRAAHAAGMACLAVTNSYPKDKLAEAEMVVESLAGLRLDEVETLLS